jgi:sterol desaturase/sphingolipid hydroxylase (fatty acid hydroxylase superfamily)
MRLSAVSYYADFFLGAAAILLLIVRMVPGDEALAQGFESLIAYRIACVVAGFVLWTLFEYAVHRVLYHNIPFFRAMHDAHHAEPNAFIGAPPVIGVVLVIAITYWPIASINDMAASGLTVGMLLGYMAYMVLHHAAHYWNVATGSWLYQARRHHALHHHHRLEGNYGITTAFWDHVFGSALEPRRRLPRANPRS